MTNFAQLARELRSCETDIRKSAAEKIRAECTSLDAALKLLGEGVMLPLLQMLQLPKRRSDLTPWMRSGHKDDASEAEEGDAALLALSEFTTHAAALLAQHGWVYEHDEGRTAFLYEESGLIQREPPALPGASEEMKGLIEIACLVNPWLVNEDGTCEWPVHVVHTFDSVAVVDVLLTGVNGVKMRQVVRVPFLGTNADVLDEMCREEEAGENLETWTQTTLVGLAALLQPAPKRVLMWNDASTMISFLQRHLGTDAMQIDIRHHNEDVLKAVTYMNVRPSPGAPMAIRPPNSTLPKMPDESIKIVEAPEGRYDVIIAVEPSLDDIKVLLQHTEAMVAVGSPSALPSRQQLQSLFDTDGKTELFSEQVREAENAEEAIMVISKVDFNIDIDAWDANGLEMLPFRLESVEATSSASDVDALIVGWGEMHAPLKLPVLMPLEVQEEDEDMWECFGPDECKPHGPGDGGLNGLFDAAERARKVVSVEYWQDITGLRVVDEESLKALAMRESDFEGNSSQKALQEHGYHVVEPPSADAAVSAKLLKAIECLGQAGYPPVFIFMYDLAWAFVHMQWAYATAVLGPCHLEPSLTAFRLNFEKDVSGVRYVGNNFGNPHRDYSVAESIDDDGKFKVLSTWQALTDVTTSNGCMYVVPRQHDAGWDKPDNQPHAPDVPPAGVKPLAPYPAGTVMSWSGNTIHWGSRCQAEGAENPRASLALVFRRADVEGDKEAPLIKVEDTLDMSVEKRLQIVKKGLDSFGHQYTIPADLTAMFAAL